MLCVLYKQPSVFSRAAASTFEGSKGKGFSPFASPCPKQMPCVCERARAAPAQMLFLHAAAGREEQPAAPSPRPQVDPGRRRRLFATTLTTTNTTFSHTRGRAWTRQRERARDGRAMRRRRRRRRCLPLLTRLAPPPLLILLLQPPHTPRNYLPTPFFCSLLFLIESQTTTFPPTLYITCVRHVWPKPPFSKRVFCLLERRRCGHDRCGPAELELSHRAFKTRKGFGGGWVEHSASPPQHTPPPFFPAQRLLPPPGAFSRCSKLARA